MINVGSKLESNARDYNPNNFEICDYCIKHPGIFSPERCHLRCCRRECKKHPIYQNPKRCFHRCKKDNYPLTYACMEKPPGFKCTNVGCPPVSAIFLLYLLTF